MRARSPLNGSVFELFIAHQRFEVEAVDHVRGGCEVLPAYSLDETFPYEQLDAIAVGCWESVKPAFPAASVDDAEQDECHLGLEGCSAAVGSVEFPPLGVTESVQAWTECVAVPTDASQPLPGWPEAPLQGEQRPLEPGQGPAKRQGEVIAGQDALVLGQGYFELDVVGCSFRGRGPITRQQVAEVEIQPGADARQRRHRQPGAFGVADETVLEPPQVRGFDAELVRELPDGEAGGDPALGDEVDVYGLASDQG
jgi:hypothetical protein